MKAYILLSLPAASEFLLSPRLNNFLTCFLVEIWDSFSSLYNPAIPRGIRIALYQFLFLGNHCIIQSGIWYWYLKSLAFLYSFSNTLKDLLTSTRVSFKAHNLLYCQRPSNTIIHRGIAISTTTKIMTDERNMSGDFLQSNSNAEISTFRKGTLSRINTGEDVMYSFVRRMLIGSAILYIPTIRPAVLCKPSSHCKSHAGR